MTPPAARMHKPTFLTCICCHVNRRLAIPWKACIPVHRGDKLTRGQILLLPVRASSHSPSSGAAAGAPINLAAEKAHTGWTYLPCIVSKDCSVSSASLLVCEWGAAWRWQLLGTESTCTGFAQITKNVDPSAPCDERWECVRIVEDGDGVVSWKGVNLAAVPSGACRRVETPPFFGASDRGIMPVYWSEGSSPKWVDFARKYARESALDTGKEDGDGLTGMDTMAAATDNMQLREQVSGGLPPSRDTPNVSAPSAGSGDLSRVLRLGCCSWLAHHFSAEGLKKAKMALDTTQIFALLVQFAEDSEQAPVKYVLKPVYMFVTGLVSVSFLRGLQPILTLGAAVAATIALLIIVIQIQSLRIREQLQGAEAATWQELKRVSCPGPDTCPGLVIHRHPHGLRRNESTQCDSCSMEFIFPAFCTSHFPRLRWSLWRARQSWPRS